MTMKIKALDRGKSLTERVAGAIQEMLISGALEPGERLNEAALADSPAVSRGPVREATRALALPFQTNSEHRQIVGAIRLGNTDHARRCGEEHVLNGKERWKESLLE
jgi:DNA-binding GntR family transcriptional regulator